MHLSGRWPTFPVLPSMPLLPLTLLFVIACAFIAPFAPLNTSSHVSRLRDALLQRVAYALFAAGFVLGGIRTLYVAPRLGTRMAELLEAPIMLVVTIVASHWIILRFRVPTTVSARLAMGCTALVLLLIAEFALVRLVRRGQQA